MTPPNASKILANLKVEAPVTEGDKFYVDLASVRGGSPSQYLATRIQDAEVGAATHQLITGFPGSGKSTELLRLQHLLGQSGYEAIYLDVDRLISKSEPLEPADILLAIGVALYEQDLGPSLFEELAARFWATMQARVSIKGGDLALFGGKISTAISQDPDLFAQVREEATQAESNLLQAVTRMVTSIQSGRAGKVVLIVDSLEHAFSLSNSAREDAEKLRQTMIQDSTLRRLPIHAVYTVSPLLLPQESPLWACAALASRRSFLQQVNTASRSG